MKNRNKSFISKSWVTYGFISFLLFCTWFFLTTWYITVIDQSALVLSYSHSKENFTKITFAKLLQKEKIAGEFVATENNLGIIALRFQKFERVPYKNEDILLFRLKEKGDKQWYYENRYRSGFIYEMPLLPFGFPLITNSKGKTYQFEVESLKGTNENAMALSRREPILFSKYQFQKVDVLSSFNNLLPFAIKKYINSFQTIDVLYSSFVFILPLFFYLLWISPFKKIVLDRINYALNKKTDQIGRIVLGKYYIKFIVFLKQITKYFFFSFLLFIICLDIFFLQVINDMVFVVSMVIWFVLLRIYHQDGRYSIIIGIILLVITSVFLPLRMLSIAECSSIWAFLFLVFGLIQYSLTTINK